MSVLWSLKNFCDQYPDRLKVVYANTSAQVKAQADWMVTSSIGLKIIEHLKQQGKKYTTLSIFVQWKEIQHGKKNKKI